MIYKIEPPTEGKVTVQLSWDDSEILLRALGWANSGNLGEFSPNLFRLFKELHSVFGRNTTQEANKYVSEVVGGQIYIRTKDGK